MPENSGERDSMLRGKLYKFLNLGLCVSGVIFVIIGVFKSTLLLYIGCAFVGAAIGGFIRSRLPINAMIPSTGVHLVYRSELRRNAQAYQNGMQTYVIMQSQQPCGIGQKKINQYTNVTKYFSNTIFSNADSFDRVSVVSAITEKADSSDNCCIVCLMQFKNGQEVRQLPCQHIFHINCIDKWLKINRLCPTCRSDITLPIRVKEETSSRLESVGVDSSETESENVIRDHCNQDATATNPPHITVVATDTEIREDQLGTHDDVNQELASNSGDVVIDVNSDITAS